MTSSKQPLQIPFSPEGHPLHYDYGHGTVYKDNYTFLARLRYKGFSRGRSSALILMEDTSTGIIYDMFMSTFDQLMNTPLYHQMRPLPGQLSGEVLHELTFYGQWTFCKKGQNFALKTL